MPTLHWIGKEKVINHHQDVPYRVLEHKYGFTADTGLQPAESPSGNLILHGDNLEALKSLLPKYEGKVKCIYIDPPYNTGNEGWVYNDNVNHPKIKKWLHQVVGKDGEDLSRHDKWLCMMYPRLKLLHKLLANDGAIFISIDDNEQANLKLICDEIFGENNFLNNIIWQKKYTQSNDAKYFSDTHDFIICYAKQKSNFTIGLFPRNDKQLNAYTNPDKDLKGSWKATPLTVKTPSDAYIYEIITPSGRRISPPKGRSWMYSQERFLEDIRDGKIWFGKTGINVPAKKSYLSEVKQGVTPKTIWLYDEAGHNHKANEEIKILLPNNPFNSPKPSKLIELILKVCQADKDSIILDSFAGSGTTAHAVLNLNKQDGGNRKFILVEMEDYAETITAERVKRVITGYADKEGTGGGFDYYELGKPLFVGDNSEFLNEEVETEKIREYVWYSETRTAYASPMMNDELLMMNDELLMMNEKNCIHNSSLITHSSMMNDELLMMNGKDGVHNSSLITHNSSLIAHNSNKYFLGLKDDTAYYFIYEKKALTTLDFDTLAAINTKAGQYVVYADNCLLPKDFMMKKNIIFKKIPRDLTRF